jgi:hypothetical protein
MGTPDISLTSLSPFCRILHNAAVYQKWTIFISLLFIISTSFCFSRKDVRGWLGGGGAVIPCTFIPGYFSILSVFFSLFFAFIVTGTQAKRERERYMASQLCRNSPWRDYIHIFVFLFLLNITQIENCCWQKWPKQIITMPSKTTAKTFVKEGRFFPPLIILNKVLRNMSDAGKMKLLWERGNISWWGSSQCVLLC